MKITFPLLFILLLSIGIESEGPMKVIEGKICDVELYDYCDENCYTDCPNIFGKRAIGFCNFDPQACICRRQC
ncbi:hypothetical protein PHAVU_011G156000 [Phaseolus vulgaris]|uniref:Knottin scorpion toxin-like domain-containing protein n=1 Tax=Phaseolus vulgaris TaxID=3885 RepID=V7AHT2_PHAVU|nr:hypothetical protein PHAVU_011G156000g [Phaseolus vulgaris]ESW05147.1 hypothetical protein PHAVU_011G156000g [Phaseolus vulgaris]